MNRLIRGVPRAEQELDLRQSRAGCTGAQGAQGADGDHLARVLPCVPYPIFFPVKTRQVERRASEMSGEQSMPCDGLPGAIDLPQDRTR